MEEIMNDIMLMICVFITACTLMYLHTKKQPHLLLFSISMFLNLLYQLQVVFIEISDLSIVLTNSCYLLSALVFLAATYTRNLNYIPWFVIFIMFLSLIVILSVAEDFKSTAVYFAIIFHLFYIQSHLTSKKKQNSGDYLLIANYSIYAIFLISYFICLAYFPLVVFERIHFILFANVYIMTLMVGLLILAFEDHQSQFKQSLQLDPLTKIANTEQLSNIFSHRLLTYKTLNFSLFKIHGLSGMTQILGIEAKDNFLISFVTETRKQLVKDVYFGRHCDDEFVFLSNNIQSETEYNQIITNSLKYAKKQLGSDIDISYKITTAKVPDFGSNYQDVYKASKLIQLQNCNIHSHVTSDCLSLIEDKFSLEKALKKAIENREIDIYFQAKFDSNNTHIVYGAEALARWQYNGNWVSPNEFIPMAESLGLIAHLDELMLEKAIEFIERCKQKLGIIIPIAVNYSAKSLKINALDKLVAKLLKEINYVHGSLEIEITESAVTDYELLSEQARNLKQMGVNIAIDDFGTGYSNLGMLSQFPANILKIDRSLINFIGVNDHMVSFTIQLAHNLGLKVVAEGVETQCQLDWLIDKKCDLIQGFLLAKPIAEEVFYNQLSQSA